MSFVVSGRAWTLGDNINTDVFAPGAYMKLPTEQATLYCLEVEPDFTHSVAQRLIVIAGYNFGERSSCEQAALTLRHLGVGAVLARSFARDFYRNAINLGLPALLFPWADEIATGDHLEVVPMWGDVRNLTTGQGYGIEPISRAVMRIIHDGGLMPHLKKKLARQRSDFTARMLDDAAR